MLPGECLCSGASPTCKTCGETVALEIYKSNTGWYIGSYCQCGPYTRESHYWPTRHDVILALIDGWHDRAGNLRYGIHPLRETVNTTEE